MKDRREFFTNLLLSIILPLLVSGGGATVLVIFQESLPPILFHTLLWVLCLFVITVIVRLAFGNSIRKLRIWVKNYQYHRKIYKLAKDWNKNFSKLADIVSIVSEQDWKPTEEQSREYFRLRVWFRRNRSKLLGSWYSFIINRTRTAYRLENHTLEYNIIKKYWEDPFSCFYDPLDLERMGVFLEEDFGTNEGDRVRYVLVRLEELTDEFVTYIKSRY